MKNGVAIFTLLILVFIFVIVSGGNTTQNSHLEKKSINKGSATFVNVELSCLAGKMQISGGAKELLAGKFEYSDPEWRPELEYKEKKKIGNLKVWMPAAERDISIDDEDVNEWDIQLNENVPMGLSIKLGGGEGDYNLSSLTMNSLVLRLAGGKLDVALSNSSLPRLDFKAIAGEATIDLSGRWENDLDADFVCGVGELNLILPQNVGVRVHATGILGNINAPDFAKENSYYTNDAYQETKATLYIDIFGGIGNVNLELK